jgi:hypothetical protein
VALREQPAGVVGQLVAGRGAAPALVDRPGRDEPLVLEDAEVAAGRDLGDPEQLGQLGHRAVVRPAQVLDDGRPRLAEQRHQRPARLGGGRRRCAPWARGAPLGVRAGDAGNGGCGLGSAATGGDLRNRGVEEIVGCPATPRKVAGGGRAPARSPRGHAVTTRAPAVDADPGAGAYGRRRIRTSRRGRGPAPAGRRWAPRMEAVGTHRSATVDRAPSSPGTGSTDAPRQPPGEREDGSVRQGVEPTGRRRGSRGDAMIGPGGPGRLEPHDASLGALTLFFAPGWRASGRSGRHPPWGALGLLALRARRSA